MIQGQFDKEKLINHWIAGSDDDFETMIAMFETKRYSWSLFVGHLVIEKLLKAYLVKVHNTYPPFIHNLLLLARNSNLELNSDIMIQLTTITAFNINTRYEDYKNSFQKKCTAEFTLEWINKIMELRLWIKEQMK